MRVATTFGLLSLFTSSVTFADITGSITDNTSPGLVILGAAAFEQSRVNDSLYPVLFTVDALFFADSLPPHAFTLQTDPAKTYVVAAIGFSSLSNQGGPDAVGDIHYNVRGDSSGLSLAITPNVNHITGRLLPAGGGTLGNDPQVWAKDAGGTFAGVTFPDSAGNFSFNYLPGAGPYHILSLGDRHYLRVDSNKTNPVNLGDLTLADAGQTFITASSNTGVPGRIRDVLSDRKNYDLTFTVYNAPSGQPLTAVTFEAPGDIGENLPQPVRYYLSPNPGNHTIGPGLDWNSVTVDLSRQPHRVTFARGTGTSSIPPGGSGTFTIRVDSMTNVAYDTYQGWHVAVRSNTGLQGRAQDPDSCRSGGDCGVESVQKILEAYDIRFDPPGQNTGTELADIDLVLRFWVRNHGNGVFQPYANWTNVFSTSAFAFQSFPTVANSIAAGESLAVLTQSVHTTVIPGSYLLFALVADSTGSNQQNSFAQYTEPLFICVPLGDLAGGPGNCADGIIDLVDLVTAVNYVVFGTPFCGQVGIADVAGDPQNCPDGIVDLVDLVTMVNYVVFGTPFCRACL